VIKSFRTSETARLFERQRSHRLPPEVHRRAYKKLLILDAAEQLEDLRTPPGNRLEKLVGKRVGQYSIRVNDQWRICFRWEAGQAFEVELCDCH